MKEAEEIASTLVALLRYTDGRKREAKSQRIQVS